ncbi:thioredoxin family protein [Chitinophaga sp. S165]|uniref:thioredoxin family protein n=1 Tax=Chitinophaga sp. S165 TaxID=2135462 RepID=UPI000D960BCA|nr:thioredoxin family protein [Chitinophaga sp. S165]PWV55700.1 thiol-disulfide isomerase/thioredoxin [Chitinophaga sp. S165]
MSKQFVNRSVIFLTVFTTLLAFFSLANAQVSGEFTQKMKPSLSGATGWVNTQPLNLKDLRGKVVLIDFWTYTCINWRRTLPYIREWASKYKDQELVVIGVHTPEFPFEKETDNVNSAIKEMHISYPVAVDNNNAIWESLQNEYWPALYLFDAKGKLRYQKFGEGDYQESELKIRELLKETAAADVPGGITTLQPEGIEAAADWGNLRSPENYLGYFRTQGFASRETIHPDKPVVFSVPDDIQLNQWALSGEWKMSAGKIVMQKKGGKIVYRFHARDLHLIMGPATPGTTVKFRVLIDGKPPGPAHGLDIDSDGNGTVTGQRMYQLIRQPGNIEDKIFEIEFPETEQGVEVYDFTFG